MLTRSRSEALPTNFVSLSQPGRRTCSGSPSQKRTNAGVAAMPSSAHASLSRVASTKNNLAKGHFPVALIVSTSTAVCMLAGDQECAKQQTTSLTSLSASLFLALTWLTVSNSCMDDHESQSTDGGGTSRSSFFSLML
eukprot:CAMPEP_0196770048 /NCGR_PEP_ID=MMETSP1104-20130614/901_1 /TAXON_ID=33652 /ORGANISM="Cafeteria sp., Strain Caron Lab Isolate" /LENGTH=137 /DNA_ID=CAMNT_0042140153 /DNA_START=122 /DNA_END=532 /DNA_ORIENTATION=-